MGEVDTPQQALALERSRRRVARRPRTSRERLAHWALVEVAVDVLMLAGAGIALELIAPASPAPASKLGWFLLYCALVLILFAHRGLYAPRLRLVFIDYLPGMVGLTAAAAMAVSSLHVLLGNDAYVAWTVHLWLSATVCLGAGRAGLHAVQVRARVRGEAVRSTLIVGAGKMGHVVARRLAQRPQLGLEPIGFLDKEPLEVGEGSAELPVLGASWDLDRIISEHNVEHVIVTFSTAPHHVLLALARRCRELGVPVSMVPRLFEIGGKRVTVEHLGELPLIAVDPVDPRGWQFTVKYALDRVFAAIALLVALPLLLATAIAIRISMGSPVVYREVRVGRDGRRFEMIKFRSMKGDPRAAGEADADWALAQLGASRADPELLVTRSDHGQLAIDDRRTRLGRLLRFYSLDELPQLVNVLRGEMSLVGPRPERAKYVERFERAVYRYGDRHRVKSGITGWAQVNGLRGKTSLPDRVEWDNFYVENWSPWLDLKIILMTIWCVLRGQHEKEPDFL
jgi:exopolysaccharide biosynthesis polyprenyl glycosylphosphotransferase